jgi:hypothetical protein
MKIPCPNPQLSLVRVEGILANGQSYQLSAGGGLNVDVPDDTVEALVSSYNPQGFSCQHAWTKEDGVQTMKLFLENKKLREKVKAYEDKQKRSAAEVTQKKREAKREEVPTPKESPKPESED